MHASGGRGFAASTPLLSKVYLKPEELNAEGEDLKVPFPFKTKDELRDLVLHQTKSSPPSNKVRGILRFYGLPFSTEQGKKPGSVYMKYPVLLVNGFQINDSYIISKTLAPILCGAPLSPELLELDEFITYTVINALLVEMTSVPSQVRKYFSTATGLKAWVFWLMSPIFPFFAPNIMRKKMRKPGTIEEHGNTLCAALKASSRLNSWDPLRPKTYDHITPRPAKHCYKVLFSQQLCCALQSDVCALFVGLDPLRVL
ncbi:hypothetical protein CYMTET_48001 [Cymbomonas tetramitiformis]|uniref:Uncharacterized protein n=1 Tax=Cymbomonas tetramitiformis TaxID=36881 RepID=A0AAE0BU60_9CHLO|nr:hypothetical protein CYMTET_48001 [Cymbomonas tetramitiformis]